MTGVKNVPELRFSEFSYEWSKSKTPIRIVAGKAYPMSAYSDSGIMLVQGQNIFPNELKVEMPVFIPDSMISESDVQINQNDILLGLNRPVIGNKLKACLYRDNRKAVLYQRAGKLVFDKSKLSSGFLYQYLFSAVFTKQLLGELVGSDQPYIKSELFNVTKNIFPELQEQQEIADFLSSVDKKVEQLTEKHCLLTEYKKGVMQQIFTQQLRFKDDNGNDYPKWEEKNLASVAQITMGTSPKSSAYNKKGNGLPLIQGNADISGRLSAPRVYTSEVTKECFDGDVLLSVRAPVGEVSRSIHHACIGRGISAIKATKNNSTAFIYQFLLWFEPRWKSLSQGSTFESVNTNDIKELPVVSPCPEEQQKIASFLTEIDHKINQAWSILEQIKAFKKGLLQKMFV